MLRPLQVAIESSLDDVLPQTGLEAVSLRHFETVPLHLSVVHSSIYETQIMALMRVR